MQKFLFLYFLHWKGNAGFRFFVCFKKKNNELDTRVSLFILNQEINVYWIMKWKNNIKIYSSNYDTIHIYRFGFRN